MYEELGIGLGILVACGTFAGLIYALRTSRARRRGAGSIRAE